MYSEEVETQAEVLRSIILSHLTRHRFIGMCELMAYVLNDWGSVSTRTVKRRVKELVENHEIEVNLPAPSCNRAYRKL